MIIAFTGHRPGKLGGHGLHNPVRHVITNVIATRLREQPVEHAISGMALGVDQWAFEACLRVGVPVVAAIPFAGQDAIWPRAGREAYAELLARAIRIEVVSSGGFAAGSYQRRNEWMVDHCTDVWAVWDGSPGGTANCVRYAERRGRPVRNLWIEISNLL